MSKTVHIPANIDLSTGEIQNAKLQSLTSTPSGVSEGMFWYDSVNHKPMYHNGTSASEFGESYTFSTGLTNTSGTITVTNYNNLLQNIATGTGSLTLLGTATTTQNSVNIGTGSTATGNTAVAIGYNAEAGSQWNASEIAIGDAEATGISAISIGHDSQASSGHGIAIGVNSIASGTRGTALGYGAEATANYAIQIGQGTNNTAKTLSIGFNFGNDITPVIKNWSMLDGSTGFIPDERLSSNIAKTSDLSNYIATSTKGVANGVAELDSSGKVPTSQLPSFVDDVIELLTMASTAPSTCSTGDKYFDTTSSKIFTATATDTWGTTGEDPEKDKIYVTIDTNYSYRWSGSSMVNIANPVGAATESTAGIAEIATQSEVIIGTDETRIVTPLKLCGYTERISTISTTNSLLIESNGSVTWQIRRPTKNEEILSVTVHKITTNPHEVVLAPWYINTTYIVIEMLASSNVSAGTYKARIVCKNGNI